MSKLLYNIEVVNYEGSIEVSYVYEGVVLKAKVFNITNGSYEVEMLEPFQGLRDSYRVKGFVIAFTGFTFLKDGKLTKLFYEKIKKSLTWIYDSKIYFEKNKKRLMLEYQKTFDKLAIIQAKKDEFYKQYSKFKSYHKKMLKKNEITQHQYQSLLKSEKTRINEYIFGLMDEERKIEREFDKYIDYDTIEGLNLIVLN